MATTTNYSWTTPDDTALVKDGAAAIRTLGSSIDTTTKNLNPQTTTGAIAYRSATSNVNTALPIGTAGQVLQVNSGATAPEWVTAGGSADSFTLLNAGGTALTGANTITVSFSAKNILLIYMATASSNTATDVFSLRFNTDSTTKYGQLGVYSGAWNSRISNGPDSVTSLSLTEMSASAMDSTAAAIYVSGANSTNIKVAQIQSGGNNKSSSSVGVYSGTSAITSISLISSLGNFDGGTVYVYGA